MSSRRTTDIQRDKTVLDASLDALVDDGANARDILFKIKRGELRGGGSARSVSRRTICGLEGYPMTNKYWTYRWVA